MKIQTYSFLFIFVVFAACTDEPKPTITIDQIMVENEGSFIYEDGLTYAAHDVKNYRIKIETRPEARIFYQNQAGNFQLQQEEWIDINPEVKQLHFYAKLPGFADMDVKKLGFSYGNQEFITTDQIENKTIDAVPHMQLISKTRGLLNYRIFNRWGLETGADSFFVDQDTATHNFQLTPNLTSGTYHILINYGNAEVKSWIEIQAGIK